MTISNRRVLIIALFVVVVLCVPGLAFRVFSMPSASMAPTLPVGRYIIVSRAPYGYGRYSFDLFELPISGRWPALAPQRGDIVVFRLPRDHKVFFTQRVVGLPGDKIQMIKGKLSINGQLVRREPAQNIADPSDGTRKVDAFTERLPEGTTYRVIEISGDNGRYDNTPEFAVPPEHLFVLGDNRDNSTDSREQSPRFGVGFVPIELVIGRVIATF
jgi:signal peptidase I